MAWAQASTSFLSACVLRAPCERTACPSTVFVDCVSIVATFSPVTKHSLGSSFRMCALAMQILPGDLTQAREVARGTEPPPWRTAPSTLDAAGPPTTCTRSRCRSGRKLESSRTCRHVTSSPGVVHDLHARFPACATQSHRHGSNKRNACIRRCHRWAHRPCTWAESSPSLAPSPSPCLSDVAATLLRPGPLPAHLIPAHVATHTCTTLPAMQTKTGTTDRAANLHSAPATERPAGHGMCVRGSRSCTAHLFT